MLNTVQSLWIGPKLSLVEQLCIKSFLMNGNPFHLYVYDHVEGIPEGTTVLDANTILPKSKIFTSHNGSVAHFADWWRWTLLDKLGGIWVDMDLIALKPFDFEEDIVFGKESSETVNVSILKFPPKYKIVSELRKQCESPNRFLPYDTIKRKIKKTLRFIAGNSKSNVGWGEVGGPEGFSRAVKHYKIFNLAKPYTYFYPIYPRNWKSIFDDTFSNDYCLHHNSYAIHIWNEFLRRDASFNILKDADKGSLFSYLVQKYT